MTAALEAMDEAAVLQPPLWLDRHQAGCALAACCCLEQSPAERRGLASPLLLALPRGGVAVAAPMARRLGMPLATWSVRKVADPADPEVAIGAVAPGGVILWRPGAASGGPPGLAGGRAAGAGAPPPLLCRSRSRQPAGPASVGG